MLVEPSLGGFIPLHVLSNGGEPSGVASPTISQPNELVNRESLGTPSSPSAIETQIDGDFEGWEGETIVKLVDGHIWEQSEYYYEYHYAFMPRVLIFKSGAGYMMKVDGVRKAVGVKQLK